MRCLSRGDERADAPDGVRDVQREVGGATAEGREEDQRTGKLAVDDEHGAVDCVDSQWGLKKGKSKRRTTVWSARVGGDLKVENTTLRRRANVPARAETELRRLRRNGRTNAAGVGRRRGSRGRGRGGFGRLRGRAGRRGGGDGRRGLRGLSSAAEEKGVGKSQLCSEGEVREKETNDETDELSGTQ